MSETTPLSTKAIPAWRLVQLLGKSIYLLLPLGYLIVGIWFELPELDPFMFGAITTGIVVYWICSVFLIPRIRYNHWRYGVNEHEIELQNGIIIARKTLIPLSRVQHVDTFQGPIFRRYDLANVMIYTAAGSHSIPALDYGVAEELRKQISSYAQLAAEDV